MKKSLRFKMTVWYTLLLIAISAVMIYVMIAVFRHYDEKDAKSRLRETVEKQAGMFREDPEKREAVERNDEEYFSPSDFLMNDVQIAIYHDKDSSRAVGMFAHGELDRQTFEEEKIRTIRLDGRNYYIYEEKIRRRRGEDFWIRGIAPAGSSMWEILQAHGAILFLVPLFLLTGTVVGFLLVTRFLAPVRKILQTTGEIAETGDLSKRIEIPEIGDEFNRIADGFNGMLQRIEENYEAEKRFASNASHELRTPVAVVLAQCDYAFENAKDIDDMYEAIESIQRQGYRMSHLIEQLLIFTRIQQNTEKYPTEEVELSDLIGQIGKDYEMITENRKFEYDLQKPVLQKINRELFSLMVTNLMQNAVRYGKEGGRVGLGLRIREDGVRIFEVSDDGIGIEEEDLPHIWERFYRGDSSRSTRGTGLGLSLVKEIVRYHGGQITVESRPGSGSRFTVFLPENTEI